MCIVSNDWALNTSDCKPCLLRIGDEETRQKFFQYKKGTNFSLLKSVESIF